MSSEHLLANSKLVVSGNLMELCRTWSKGNSFVILAFRWYAIYHTFTTVYIRDNRRYSEYIDPVDNAVEEVTPVLQSCQMGLACPSPLI